LIVTAALCKCSPVSLRVGQIHLINAAFNGIPTPTPPLPGPNPPFQIRANHKTTRKGKEPNKRTNYHTRTHTRDEGKWKNGTMH